MCPGLRTMLLAALGALLALAPATASALCAPPEGHPIKLISARPDPQYDGLFSLQPDGWLGGDIAHSIPLGGARVLWLFGDTFVGTSSGSGREGGATIINGSIAIQEADGSVSYALGDDPTGFFAHQSPPSAGDYYWTTQGISLDGELYIFAMNVVSLFEQQGLSVIHVPNPQDPPSAWQQEVSYVDVGETTRMYHAGLLVRGEHVYMMGFDDSLGYRRTVLARVSATAVKAGLKVSDFNYWTQGTDGPEWSLDDADLVTLIETGVTESSLTFDDDLGLYLYVVYDVFGGDISISTAQAITGPWTEPACVYHAPEVDEPRYDVLAYAGRLHPELSPGPGELVLSYVTNTWGTLAPLFTPDGADLYVPQLVRVQVEVPGLETPTPTASPTPDGQGGPGGCDVSGVAGQRRLAWLVGLAALFCSRSTSRRRE